jgi:hypothetical protein
VRRIALLTGLAAVAALGAIAAPASALTRAQCNTYITRYQNSSRAGTIGINTTRCLISRQRTNNGMSGYVTNGILSGSATAHNQASVAAKSWSTTNGLVSHLDPGTAVPGDPNQLQNLANQQIDARIRGAGYCAGGRAFSDGEITYGGSGTGATPKAAITFWMNDPPHRAAVLSPTFKNYGVSVLKGSAFPGQDDASSSTYVVDLGSCTP